ncbi:MAG: putative hydro-lyase [Desulfobacteraceae bacterium]|nr:putative hydro-lyase [Desulfobacteraceae bacterium]
MTPEELRHLAATGEFDHHTAGYCEGYVQANLVALPHKYSFDFLQFCKNNSKPCPVLEVVGPNSHQTHRLADNADLLNTIPRYLVFKDGVVDKEVNQIMAYYTDDLVFFLIGCSFSFEQALICAGIPLRHIEQNKNVSMYNTNIPLKSSGPFSGNMVVSMRPIHQTLVDKAHSVTSAYPDVHGAPIHKGNPGLIGIKDIDIPDYGDSVEIKPDEVPVFWACGVTPQNALVEARLPIAFTHAPGFMFVSDIRNEEFLTCQS